MTSSTTAAGRSKTLDMAYIALFTVLIAVCAWISIPTLVPFTLQTFGIFLATAVLGGKRGSLAVAVYLLLGAVGVPVFANFTGGLGMLLGVPAASVCYTLLRQDVRARLDRRSPPPPKQEEREE